MNLHELKPFAGSTHRPKRLGRGPGSGHGKTSCRGHKGQRARSGSSSHPDFEGGQTPLYRRVPKRGFHSRDKKVYDVINLGDLDKFSGKVAPDDLVKAGFIKDAGVRYKVLSDGDLTRSLEIKAHAFSKKALDKIKKAGGKAEII